MIYTLRSAKVGLAFSAWYSFRVLRFPDLAIEGTYVLGAVTAALVTTYWHGSPLVVVGLPLAVLAGAAGALLWSSCLITLLKAPKIVGAVVAYLALYSVNLLVLGMPNRPFPEGSTFSDFIQPATIGGLPAVAVAAVLPLASIVLATGIYSWWSRSLVGLRVAGAGVNPVAFRLTGRNDQIYLPIGLAISGALAALSGALSSHYQRYADVNMGVGYLVLALGSVFISDLFSGSTRHRPMPVLALLGGLLTFKTASALALEMGTPPALGKLVHAALLAVVLGLARFTGAGSAPKASGDFA